MMSGLVIFTGANSSLAIFAAEHLLQNYPNYTVIFTVRNASKSDANTELLRDVISKHGGAKASILPLDLADLTATHDFADKVIAGIQSGEYPPLFAIVCNAYYWNLVGGPESTKDGFDKTTQVTHIAHAALVLRLLGSFGNTGGRITLLSTDAHWPGKNAMEVYPPSIDNLNDLIKPTDEGNKQGRGYQRYASAKLAVTAWMYALNQHLEKDENLAKITAVAVNPGNLVDSRALRTNTSSVLQQKQRFLFRPLLPILKLFIGPTLRTAAPAGVDLVELTLSPQYRGKRGFYTLLRADESSPDSLDERKQSRVWEQTLEWANITKADTALQHGL